MGYGPIITRGNAEYCPTSTAGSPMTRDEQLAAARGVFEAAVTAVREAVDGLARYGRSNTGTHGPGLLDHEPSAIALQALAARKFGLIRAGTAKETIMYVKPSEPVAHIGPVI
jgi:hypothetical protein